MKRILLLVVMIISPNPSMAEALSRADCASLIKPMQLYVGKIVEFQKLLAEPIAPEPGFARPPVAEAGKAVEDARAALVEPYNKYSSAFQTLLNQLKQCARQK
jgi:hypothetical protein